MRPAVFLDRDGTLNASVVRQGKPYPPDTVEAFTLLEGVTDGCSRLKQAGYLLVVVTNQPDVGRGTQSQGMVESIHHRLCTLVPEIDLVKVCYHGGSAYGQPCNCRKPKPTLLLEAASAWGIDLPRSWMVGDRWRDVDCGNAAGCRTVFIDRGYDESLRTRPEFRVKNFGSGVDIILNPIPHAPHRHPRPAAEKIP